MTLILSSINIWHKIHEPLIQGDEIYEMFRANNKTLKSNEFDTLDKYSPHSMSEVLKAGAPTKQGLRERVLFYIKNWFKLSNHGPGYGIITKLPILNSYESILNLRYLSAIFCFLSLLVFIFLLKSLELSWNQSLLAGALYISLSQIHSIAAFAKVYSFLLFIYLLTMLCFIQFLKSNHKFLYGLITIVLINLCLISYFFSAVYLALALSMIAVYFKNNIKLHNLLVFALVYIINHLAYIDLTKKGYEATNITPVIEGSYPLLKELNKLLKQAISFYGFNFNDIIAIPLALLLLFLLINKAHKKPNSILALGLSLVPFISIFIIDFALNKHFVLCQRYFYVSLPFVALLWFQIVENFKTRYASLIVLIFASLVNSFFPKIQRFEYNSFVYPDSYKLAQKIANAYEAGEKPLLVFPSYGGYVVIFTQYLKAFLENSSPLKKIELEGISRYKDVHVVNIKTLEHTKSLELNTEVSRIYFIDYEEKLKKPSEYREYFAEQDIKQETILLNDVVF